MATFNLTGIPLYTVLDNYDLSLGDKEVSFSINGPKYGLQASWLDLTALDGTITILQSLDDINYDVITDVNDAVITIPLGEASGSAYLEDLIGTSGYYLKLRVDTGTNTTGNLTIHFRSFN